MFELSVQQMIFFTFSTLLVASALSVITMRNPVRAALSLVVAFVSAAAIWLLLEAEFLAIVLVLVYVGAVMVLFLFVVMMLDINLVPLQEGFARYLPLGLLIAAIIAVEIGMIVGPENFGLDKVAAPARHMADYSNTSELGSVLYTVYVYPFEIASVILLVAIVAAIALTFRRRPGTKKQKPEQQVAVNRNDRVRLVKMAAEKKE